MMDFEELLASYKNNPRRESAALLFTDPVLGPQRLAKRTSAHLGGGLRLFFCDTFDMGVGWQHAITGKYLANDFGRFEVRYRY